MHSFARDLDFSSKKGKKKTVRRIKVQSTSVSWRLYKSLGNTTSRKGRPPKVVLPKKREGEIVSHCLPKFKKVKKMHPHSLSQSVSANRAAEKKTLMNPCIDFQQLSSILIAEVSFRICNVLWSWFLSKLHELFCAPFLNNNVFHSYLNIL